MFYTARSKRTKSPEDKQRTQLEFEEVNNEAEGFLMEDGEDHKEMYRRLKSLV